MNEQRPIPGLEAAGRTYDWTLTSEMRERGNKAIEVSRAQLEEIAERIGAQLPSNVRRLREERRLQQPDPNHKTPPPIPPAA